MRLHEMEAAGELEPLAHSPEELENLLRMAARRAADAQLAELSAESRVVNAYQCVLACAKAALRALDYRVPNITRQHYLTLETLRDTLDLNVSQISYCQSLRSKRHRDEYEGTLEASDTEAEAAVAFASGLLSATKSKLRIP